MNKIRKGSFITEANVISKSIDFYKKSQINMSQRSIT